ncbi:porin [Bradyrhizobium sp. U87765 SZCCT0131]|uniref:porin n=1 Tax=unclassified Bradyrhizobium TaxID=2631580 RepID=UPI001BAC16F7|nr:MULTISPECIES: porin [unclassified Bradyrhizobium]MBR1223123.1 porin [Bradyrhizobium sp. U87765 SZCCT0131]MBR1262831.1 porin [Bradyrhizobium sp. U87765 SZCCT0134]MBR1309328.1 porin [Bradyrhizobium sp. U87765 SZCCT0110]MBR1318640.1 porin [Bradyrhizobium sp. U87765 SZCCT0109]MBR1352514.1 porin [Bradyrhizobium sp. U87765 SZCCT0048]
MTTMKGLILGTAASLVALTGAQAADLPVKAKAVEYVKICSLYGAGFYYIPGTDTCIRIGGALRVGTSFNGGVWGVPFYQGGAGGAGSYNRNYFTTRERITLFVDTRTQTDYGVVRTYANMLFDFSQGRESIAGGYIENDFIFIQFAGFTFGKAVSQFDPQWTLAKPLISTSGFFSGSYDATGIPQLSYTAEFGNGVSASLSLEDAQPYRSSGVVNTSLGGTNALLGPFGSATTAYGVTSNNFQGNAQGGDHVPDIVANVRLDQAWGSLHLGAAAHEVHGTYYNPADSNTGHPDSTWGYAVIGAFELKNLPTGVGDSLKVQATFANGAAKYVFGGTWDSAGAGRLAKIGDGGMAFGYVLDGVYGLGTGIQKSDSWEVSGFYEHYWTPAWRTSVFGSYSHISYGSAGDALLLAAANGGRLSTGVTNATGSFGFGVMQFGTRTAWDPVKNLTVAAEFDYTRLEQNLNGTFTNTSAYQGVASGTTLQLKDQNIYSGHVQVTRSF